MLRILEEIQEVAAAHPAESPERLARQVMAGRGLEELLGLVTIEVTVAQAAHRRERVERRSSRRQVVSEITS